jgi:hypothetical protein
MDRIPNAGELSSEEFQALRSIVGGNFTPRGSVNALQQNRLIALGLVHYALGGLMPTPAGRIVARMR